MRQPLRHVLWSVLLLGCLPAAQAASTQPATTYTVKRGDTLWSISQKHKLTVERLKTLNHLKNNTIYSGQKLKLSQVKITVPKNPPLPFAVAMSSKKVLQVPVYAVHVNLAHPGVHISPLLPAVGLGHGGAKLPYLAQRRDLVAAINGGYFHPQSYIPAGDLVFQGRQLASGRIQTALSVTPDNKARIHDRLNSWKGYETVIATGPHVVQNGRLVIQPRSEGYRDPAVWGRARRSAVGLVNNEYLIFMTSPQHLTLAEVGKIMMKMKAKEVILLDGGSSAGMVWEKKLVVPPARSLAFGIGVFLRKKV
ncbi:phosphodiester glycosidase family protein [Deinococcus roseus]|uniref:LysM domain-containing protein n=1 Tax=Deinococcus roseus TaxID=392414 RepID=A0ABQ2CUK9_9DEIO|nr:phosphodiester glycosidase family protein [Deinococcus roseus]GGJ22358.1 hypothetical protein GCM10008938_05770 [Deinococcus roseus]